MRKELGALLIALILGLSLLSSGCLSDEKSASPAEEKDKTTTNQGGEDYDIKLPDHNDVVIPADPAGDVEVEHLYEP